MPLEYCEYSPGISFIFGKDHNLKRIISLVHVLDPERCREWLERNLPDLLNQMQANSGSADGDKAGEKKRQTRGGKGMAKGKKKFEPQKIVVSKAQRKGNKYVTIVQGLASNGKRTICHQLIRNKFN